MGIKSSSLPDSTLFHAVNPSYNRNGFVFTFLPQLKEEAITLVAALPVYCKHFHGDTVDKWFSPEAIHRTRDATWDEKLGYATTKKDFAVGNLVEMDKHFHASEISIEMPPELTDGSKPGGVTQLAGGGDSVSTFRQPENRPQPPPAPDPTQHRERTDNKSTVSAISIESRMSKVEDTNREQSKQLTQITKQLATLTEHLLKKSAPTAADGSTVSGNDQ